MEAWFFLFLCVLLALGLLWPPGAILFSRKASWRRKSSWIGLWLVALLACFTVEYFHYRYLLESGYPRKLISRDAFNGVAIAMLLNWAMYFLFRYRTGDFPAATAAVRRMRFWFKP